MRHITLDSEYQNINEDLQYGMTIEQSLSKF